MNKQINIVVGKDEMKVHQLAANMGSNCGDFSCNGLYVSVTDYPDQDFKVVAEEVNKIYEGRDEELLDDTTVTYIY